MLSLSHATRAFAAALICATITVNSVFGANENGGGGPPRVTFESGSLPSQLIIDGVIGFEGGLGGVSAKNGARGIFVQAISNSAPTFRTAKSDRYYVGYPILQEGDFIPMFSAVYRVHKMWRDDDDSGITLRRLPDKEDKHELPKGVSVSRGTYVFPMGFGAVGNLHGLQVRAYPVVNAKDEPPDPLTVKIVTDLRHRFDERQLPNDHTKTSLVKVGDTIPLGKVSHRVTNIVPPNPKLQVIGWVEIDQTPETKRTPEE